jgi:hypothetical protein
MKIKLEGKNFSFENGKMNSIEISAGSIQLTAYFQMKFRTELRYNNAVSIFRGPLLYR